MKNKITISNIDNSPCINYGLDTDKNTLYDGIKVSCDHDRLTLVNGVYNRIIVSEDIAKNFARSFGVLFSSDNGKFIEVVIEADYEKNLNPGTIKITPFISNTLEIEENANLDTYLILCHNKNLSFSYVRAQKLRDIFSDKITISNNAQYIEIFKNYGLVEVVNLYTNDSFFIKTSHVDVEKALAPSEIRLNRKQRLMLHIDYPSVISIEHWDKIINSIDNDRELKNKPIIKKDLKNVYEKTGKRFCLKSEIDQISYQNKVKIKKYINKIIPTEIVVKPVLETFKSNERKSVFRKISDIFVGESVLTLTCKRPYENDENSTYVRLSEENMKRLGIDEADQVIISYKDRWLQCSVLSMSDEEEIKKTNKYINSDLTIGIPAHMRNSISILDLQSSVRVERDTWFLLKKSANEQLIPLLFTILSLSVFDFEWWQYFLAFCIVAPIIVYINLSGKRNMRTGSKIKSNKSNK